MSDTQSTNPDRARLLQHFSSNPSDPSRWESLWATSYMPWDRASPSPALVDLLSSRHSALNPPVLAPPSGDKYLPPQHQAIRRPRALVPGCGRGYDVLLLAAWGFDALGVEYASTAVKQAAEYVEKVEAELAGEGRGEVSAEEVRVYEDGDKKVGRGSARVVEGDFFDDGWWKGDGGERYELIYDYTFFSALPPESRAKWAGRMAELLAPGGRLVCLEFPTYKDPKTGGPPWATPPKEYVAYLSRPGEKVKYGEDGHVVDIDEEKPSRSEKGLVRVAHFQPERTHEIGKGTDWLSVWKHQSS
ncbi:S-adenosyl-L-methionine-dependent methyltransferase [Myriangium duriaei CBS 260.36]|uniref:S-adenosyl-L-methionine-dependent methyltransferase n=1 Tax=Myriangium duriaei CBS 260.36 TaxID=1168546 RepID=A0A9P4MI48_9PEZI|nr:S-adenosyl-L-methionine-dependent methyltransferase [Myriangium duriaei CBS 260.36]